MRVLALIIARGKSKRVPNKNLRLLGGAPLISRSIDVAKGFPEVCDILVSTDSPLIADIARKSDVLVPWLRPRELATDEASAVDVSIHALDWYETTCGVVDGLLLLQPTSPFRTRASVKRGIALFQEHGGQPVIGVSLCRTHPFLCFEIIEERMRPFIQRRQMHMRSQELPPAYKINGSFYLVSPLNLRRTKSFFSYDMVPLVASEPAEGLDIDTEWDWKLAEAILAIDEKDKARKRV